MSLWEFPRPVLSGFSSKNGFSIFLKEFYASNSLLPGDGEDHWFERRKVLFQQARTKWSESSQEFKAQKSAEAKQLNKESKAVRTSTKRKFDQIEQDCADVEKQAAERQCHLLKAAVASGLICPPVDCLDSAPALFRPKAVAQHARDHNLTRPLPITNLGVNDERQIAESTEIGHMAPEALAEFCSRPEVVECVDDLLASEGSLHGLGDRNFGVSEAMVAHLIENSKGFVNNSHKQLCSAHGSMCDKLCNNFDLEAADEDFVQIPRSCEHLCGQYCKSDIKNHQLFVNATEMVKTIARVMAKKRCVKLGKQMYLSPGPETYFPVLLIQTSDSDPKYFAWLACRVSFNPLEVDFIQCEVTVVEGESGNGNHFKVDPTASQFTGSSNLSFLIDSCTEFAVWFSLHYEETWRCKLFLKYDVVATYPYHILLTPEHSFSEATSTSGTGFAEELPVMSAATALTEEERVLAYVSKLMKSFDPKAKVPTKSVKKPPAVKKQGRKQAKAKTKAAKDKPEPGCLALKKVWLVTWFKYRVYAVPPTVGLLFPDLTCKS